MPAIVVRDVPAVLHQRLKQEAERHHRSMNREIIAILEKKLQTARSVELPRPIEPKVPVDGRWIAEAIRRARDSRP